MTLRLYVNPRTPGQNDKASDYTEVVGGGYHAIPLLPEQWTVRGKPPVATYSKQVFTFSGHVGDIHGHYVTLEDGTLLTAGEKEGGPAEILRAKDEYRVVVSFGLNDNRD